jgi:hypothetical protein
MSSENFPGLQWLANDPKHDSDSMADARAMWAAWDADAKPVEQSVLALAEGKKTGADERSAIEDLSQPHPKLRRILLKSFSGETIETVDEDERPERFATWLALPTTVSIVAVEGEEVFRELVPIPTLGLA